MSERKRKIEEKENNIHIVEYARTVEIPSHKATVILENHESDFDQSFYDSKISKNFIIDDKSFDEYQSYLRTLRKLKKYHNAITMRELKICQEIETIYQKSKTYELVTQQNEIMQTIIQKEEDKIPKKLEMKETYVKYINDLTKNMNGDFIDFIIKKNLQNEDEEYSTAILIHCINYSPSMTLSQLYNYIFTCSYSVKEIIEFLFEMCERNEFFQLRSRYILNRYYALSEGMTISILKNLCSQELFLAPIYAKFNVENLNDDIINDSEKSLLIEGKLVNAKDFYDTLFTSIDPLNSICSFLIQENENIEHYVANFNYIDEILSFVNNTYWHYDGKFFNDSKTNERVEFKKNDNKVENLYTTIERKILQIPNLRTRLSNTKKNTKSKMENNFRVLLKESYEDMKDKWLSKSTSTNEDSVRPTCTHFDIYIDTSAINTFKRIMQNLYLQRFELFTPALNTCLIINYDDFRPPKKYRFSEIKNNDIRTFVQYSLAHVNPFFTNAISLDIISRVLYSEVFERVLKNRNFNEDEKFSTEKNIKIGELGEKLQELRDKDRRFKSSVIKEKDVLNIVNKNNCILSLEHIEKIANSTPDSKEFFLAMINVYEFFNRDSFENPLRLLQLLLGVSTMEDIFLKDANTMSIMREKNHIENFDFLYENVDEILEKIRKEYDIFNENDKTKEDFEREINYATDNLLICNEYNKNAELSNLKIEIEKYRNINLILMQDDLSNRTTNTSTSGYEGFVNPCDKISTFVDEISYIQNTKPISCFETMRNFLSNERFTKFLKSRKKNYIMTINEKNKKCHKILSNITLCYIILVKREISRYDNLKRINNCPLDGNFMFRLARYARTNYYSLNRLFPEQYLHSNDTNNLAESLSIYVERICREDTEIVISNNLDQDTMYSISLAIISLYIYSKGSISTIIFLLQFILSIKYPGCYLHSPLILQGSSSSGKSLFVSNILRPLYSSSLKGAINNSTLRMANKDEINTDLQSVANSHVCQCDEPDFLNHETLKNIMTAAFLKSRKFFSQSPTYLIPISKLIITTNDNIQMKCDEGVLTRLRMVMNMNHKFQKIDETSLSKQFVDRIFPQGINYEKCLQGMFYVNENFSIDFATYEDSKYYLSDLISRIFISKKEERFFEIYKDKFLENISFTKEGTIKILNLSLNDEISDPVRLDIPDDVEANAKNLHRTIDPYTLLLNMYHIKENMQNPMDEHATLQFIKTFLDDNCSNMAHKGSLNQSATRLLERLKINFHNLYDSDKKVFYISFTMKIRSD